MNLQKSNFEAEVRGKKTQLFLLENMHGFQCAITNYGARIVALTAPDSLGNMEDVVLGFDNIAAYIADANSYFGAVVGRVANRTAGASFRIDGELFRPDANHGEHHIHGGFEGLHKQVWDADAQGKTRLCLSYLSMDGESGYPGEVRIEVQYTLTDQNELDIRYGAWSNQITPLNLTNHTYFNLAGAGSGAILRHSCQIFADAYHPIDQALIPTGFAVSVDGTPFDFRQPCGIGARIGEAHEQLKRAGGYDHNFILNAQGKDGCAASITEPVSKRRLDLITDRAGLQFYSGNFLDGSQAGKNQKPYTRRSGFCLEAQAFPNSLNQQGFPSILIHPDMPYSAFCTYRFGLI